MAGGLQPPSKVSDYGPPAFRTGQLTEGVREFQRGFSCRERPLWRSQGGSRHRNATEGVPYSVDFPVNLN
jgi:hypothetical protein